MSGPPTISARLLATAHPRGEGVVTATEPGVLAGGREAIAALPEDLAPLVELRRGDGEMLAAGDAIAACTGTAIELQRIEDHLLGVLGVASGIATRAHTIVSSAPTGLRIVCGGWKKLPPALKPVLRAALDAAGIGHRLLPHEFVYVDKNAVTMLGGIAPAVGAGLAVENGPVAVQVKDPADIATAIEAGAGAVMVDTGSITDLRAAQAVLDRLGRADVVLAFGGGARIDDLGRLRAAGADVVDLGRAILDAPLLDLRFDVRPLVDRTSGEPALREPLGQELLGDEAVDVGRAFS